MTIHAQHGKTENRSVSLYPHQREAFNKLGGSKWLQKMIEAEIEKDRRKKTNL